MACNCSKCPAQRCTPSGRPSRGVRRWLPALIFVAFVVLLASAGARAEVLHSKESALRLAFPEADSVTTCVVLLTEEQNERVREVAGTALPSRVAKVYQEWRSGRVSGYGFIDTHKVRSLPETLLIVVEPDGRLRAVHLLAFHEPEQYRAPERWYSQFAGRALGPELSIRRDIAGIAGSTLTANAVTASVRRTLAFYEIALGHSRDVAAASATSATACDR